MRVTDIPQIAELSTPEKILLVEDLWETIASEEADVPVPQSHADELDARLNRRRASEGRLLSLEDLQARMEARK